MKGFTRDGFTRQALVLAEKISIKVRIRYPLVNDCNAMHCSVKLSKLMPEDHAMILPQTGMITFLPNIAVASNIHIR